MVPSCSISSVQVSANGTNTLLAWICLLIKFNSRAILCNLYSYWWENIQQVKPTDFCNPEDSFPTTSNQFSYQKPVSIIYQQSWLTREDPVDWKLQNMTPLWSKGHCGKAFATVSHSMLQEKLAAHGLDRCAVCWVKAAWMTGPREWWGMELHPAGSWSPVVFPWDQY